MALSNDAGNVVEKYYYDTFGRIVIKDTNDNTLTQSAFGNFYTYTGRELDAESGLYFYRARYYDPTIGRFINRDPAGDINGPNLYTYVKNNPINYVDPDGQAAKKNQSNEERLREKAAQYGITMSLETAKAILDNIGKWDIIKLLVGASNKDALRILEKAADKAVNTTDSEIVKNEIAEAKAKIDEMINNDNENKDSNDKKKKKCN
jgi:RHS repeat-associated protein